MIIDNKEMETNDTNTVASGDIDNIQLPYDTAVGLYHIDYIREALDKLDSEDFDGRIKICLPADGPKPVVFKKYDGDEVALVSPQVER